MGMAVPTQETITDTGGGKRKTRIFISYSRKDSSFAAYLDIHHIRPSEPWQERLSGLITRADSVFLPESKFCCHASM